MTQSTFGGLSCSKIEDPLQCGQLPFYRGIFCPFVKPLLDIGIDPGCGDIRYLNFFCEIGRMVVLLSNISGSYG
jgi:hypothetical protein